MFLQNKVVRCKRSRQGAANMLAARFRAVWKLIPPWIPVLDAAVAGTRSHAGARIALEIALVLTILVAEQLVARTEKSRSVPLALTS